MVLFGSVVIGLYGIDVLRVGKEGVGEDKWMVEFVRFVGFESMVCGVVEGYVVKVVDIMMFLVVIMKVVFGYGCFGIVKD